jgi:pyruvate dehydrogenase E1 component
MREMVERQRDVFYYLTVTNENYPQPSAPTGDYESLRVGVLKGIHPVPDAQSGEASIQLLGSGAILGEVLAAARLLRQDWGIEAAVWSVTSFTELHRDGVAAERNRRLSPAAEATPAYVTSVLGTTCGPVVAATDYVRAVPELIRAFVPRRYVTLGTDGFGRSDTRAALREFFEVDRISIVIAALGALADEGSIERTVLKAALERYARGGAPAAPTWER